MVYELWNGPTPDLSRVVGDGRGPGIVLVHGLGGSAASTWKRMLTICRNEPTLDSFSLQCFVYPSSRLSLPFMGQLPTLHDLADGLATELEVSHSDHSDIMLVGHSLGGLIVRQYIVNELKAGRTPKASKVLLYAVPNTGAELARVASMLSRNQRQLRQLCRNADVLKILNEDWNRNEVEKKINVLYAVGGRDSVVSRDSAKPFYDSAHVATLVESDHQSIIQPVNSSDLRFKILKKFALGEQVSPLQPHIDIAPSARDGDPLFDIYSPADEPYYVQRDADTLVRSSIGRGVAWVFGPSGVGKTAALMRCAMKANWHLRQIILGGSEGRNALQIAKTACTEFGDLVGIAPETFPSTVELSELIPYFRRLLRAVDPSRPVALLIEEIPLVNPKELSAFLAFITQLSQSIAADSALVGRVFIAISSIEEPIAEGSFKSKILERVQIVKFDVWSDNDLNKLASTLSRAIKPDLTSADRGVIVQSAVGSPRFVKTLFRRWRNGTGTGYTLQRLIEQSALENS